jgi:hypothetical protein
MIVAKESQDPAELNNNTYSEDIILPQSDLWSDEPPLESDEHRDEIELLLECIKVFGNLRIQITVFRSR